MGNRSSRTKNGTTTSYSYVRGNLLSSIGSDSYYYNSDNIRFRKIANGVTTDFYLDGNKILGEDRSDGKKFRYFYDIDGLCGFRYGEDFYEYVRNAYGDIVMIAKDGELIAQYFYDAWGNHIVANPDGTTNNTSSFIGNVNPFRWKSHYYDSESGLYYANGSYYDPEVGQHVDAVKLSSIIDNAFTIFGLDINGIMCDNILAYLPYIYTIITTLELSPDPTYDPDVNKPWWELAWNAVVKWFASVVKWFHDLDIGWKIGIGVTLFAIACIITVVTTIASGGTAAAAWAAVGQMTLQFIIGVVSATAISTVVALVNGESIPDALVHGLADGIFWGGVFAFVSANVNMVKALVRHSKVVGTPHKVGKNGEDYISKVTGLEKNTKSIQAPTSGNSRIPDFIDYKRGVLIESKNVARQSMTNQLRDFIDISKSQGLRMELYVRQGTIISKNIDPFIIIKYFPW